MSHQVLDIIAKSAPHNKWIKENTIFLTVSGSRSFGTNLPESDTDFKGITISTKEYFFSSYKTFEQAELKDPHPDTVIYDIRKFFKLATSNNPNCLEMLYTDPSDHIIVDSIGQELLDHKQEFLSKRVKNSFLGYSLSELSKLERHKKWIDNPIKEPPTRKSLGLPEQTLIPKDQLAAVTAEIQKHMDRIRFDFMDNLDEINKIDIRKTMAEMLAELQISKEDQWLSAARIIGLSDNFIELMQRERKYSAAKKEWDKYQDWKKNRNPKRSALEEKLFYDPKNASHLIRISRMGEELLLTGKMLVKRPDAKELIEIRLGSWSYEKIIEYVNAKHKRINELYDSCTILPNEPDKIKLDNLCISLIEKSLSKYSWYKVKKIISHLNEKFSL